MKTKNILKLLKILSMFTNQKITDSHGGMRAMNTSVVEQLEMLGTHTYVQETIIDAYEKGFRILEIPSVWKKRNLAFLRRLNSKLMHSSHRTYTCLACGSTLFLH